ncbi:DUF2963 domain-containing protein, partial [Candidatus Phytoplasma solani]
KELKEAGFTIHELIQLPNIGLELRELKITPQKCLNLNCSSKLIQEFGYSSPELKRIGLSFNIARDGFIKNITQFDPKTGNKIRTNFFDSSHKTCLIDVYDTLGKLSKTYKPNKNIK